MTISDFEEAVWQLEGLRLVIREAGNTEVADYDDDRAASGSLSVAAWLNSRIYPRLPLRMMHYVACFHDHLLKNGVTTARKGLPPVFPLVLYNGSRDWSAVQDVYDMIQPAPPSFLRAYQPHLRYYLVEEKGYSDDELAERDTPLSGIFGIENASAGYEALQAAVDRTIASIQSNPNKERMDAVTTRWIKRHFERLGAGGDLTEMNSLVEDRNMLADNLENWAKREREEGVNEGRMEGRMTTLESTLRHQIKLKFGEVPAWANQRIQQANEAELGEWVVQILSADSLETLLNA